MINEIIVAVSLSFGQSAESGIAEYNQVLRMIAEGRAAIIAGNPDNYVWECLDKIQKCEVKK